MAGFVAFAQSVYHRLPLPARPKARLRAVFHALFLPPTSPMVRTAVVPAGTFVQCADVTQKDRRQKMLSRISPAHQDGLEVGALYRPIVTKRESGGRIHYVDFTTTEELRDFYRDHPVVKANEIVEVDYVWGEKSFAESVGEKRFDYALASHVIEHVPDMLGWLREIAEILKDGGVLSLAIPDKRYTYDYWRQLTTPGTLLEAYLLHKRRPSARDIFDHLSQAYDVDLQAAWRGEISETTPLNHEQILNAFERAQESVRTDKYQDVHVNVLTPSGFFYLLELASHIGLLDFTILDFYDTAQNALEFFVSLQRVPRGLDPQEMLQKQLASLEWARGRVSKFEPANPTS